MGSQLSRVLQRGESSSFNAKQNSARKFQPILDRFESFEDVQEGLRQAGLESSQLVVGIDFTKSNEWTGKHSFQGKCLHTLSGTTNFYQRVLYCIAMTLEPFDDDHLIPCYGFGDISTHDKGVFPFYANGTNINGLHNVLERYKQIVPHINLSGPTSFAPLIHQAINIVIKSDYEYHILLIICDGQVTPNCIEATQNAIVVASNYPLSITTIGVGDGPWDEMRKFDDELPTRKFDNFQFVEFNRVMDQASVYGNNENRINAHFAKHALMEIPDQYKEIQRLRLDSQRHPPPIQSKRVLYDLPPTVEQADRVAANFI